MSFGFPAYSTGSQRFDVSPRDLVGVVGEALSDLGWRYEKPTHHTFVARSSVNAWSWGEKIAIEVSHDGTVSVRSECLMATQCVDWGKNGRNVRAFFGELSRVASEREASRPPAASYDAESLTPVERLIREGGEVER